jgi:rare lipoprotein A
LPYPPGRDGPDAHPPAHLDEVPDAVPKIEPIRPGGPNKPYEVLGQRYVPLTSDEPFTERGLASWYGRKFQGHPTASGELYNMYAMTAAHPTLPIPSYVRVRNPANGREVIVRVNDRGPFHSKRIIDLSYTAALKLDLLKGVAPVEIERITYDDIRTGAWRRDGREPGATMLARAQAQPAGAPAAGERAAAVRPPSQAEASAPAEQESTASVTRAVLKTGDDAAAAAAAGSGIAAGGVERIATTAADATTTAGAALPAVAPPIPPAAAAPAASAPNPTVADAATPIETASQPARAYTAAARGFWVQLGAFHDVHGAVDFERRVQADLDWLAPLLAIFDDHHLHRLQAGPYQSRSDALSAAERIRSTLQLVPVIVERR